MRFGAGGFAIFIAGVWLRDEEWRHFEQSELLINARCDFLPDGAHVELSPHYHCIALRNFIEAMQIADDNGLPFPAELLYAPGDQVTEGAELLKLALA